MVVDQRWFAVLMLLAGGCGTNPPASPSDDATSDVPVEVREGSDNPDTPADRTPTQPGSSETDDQPDANGVPETQGIGDAAETDSPFGSEAGPAAADEAHIAALLSALVGGKVAAREDASRELEPLLVSQRGALTAAFASPDPQVRRGVTFFFLDRFQEADVDVIQGLTSCLDDEEAAVRQIALAAAKRFPSEALTSATPLLVKILNAEREQVTNRAAVARLLASSRAEPQTVLPALTEAVRNDPAVPVRSACVMAIARIAEPKTAARVLAAVLTEDEVASVRGLAATNLGKLGPKAEESAAKLAAALADPDDSVRLKAAAALGTLGPAAVGPLTEQLGNADAKVRLLALGTLIPLGSAAAPAAETVAAMLEDKDPAVRKAAQLVLPRLKSQ